MKILFIGLLYNPTEEAALLTHSKVGISVASNLFQWNLIRGINYKNPKNIEVLGSIPFGNFPSLSNKLFCKKTRYNYCGISTKEIGFLNFYLIKHKQRQSAVLKYIKRWTFKNKEDDLFVIFYDLYLPFLNNLKRIRRLSYNIKTGLIVPDLAGKYRNDMGNNKFKQFILNQKSSGILTKSRNADFFILLTEQMKDVLQFGQKPYMIIDGIVNDFEVKDVLEPHISEKRVFMYAGALMKQYNISMLLSAINKLYDYENFEFWFCGKGDAEEEIKKAAQKNKRIKYLGFLSKSEVQRIEKDVTFYINPRTNDGLYTKYSFPSKNLEYLLAGRPVIAYKLDGISKEYDEVFYYIESKNENSLIEKLKNMLDMSLDEITIASKKSHDFVLAHNGAKRQAERLINFLGSL